MRKVLVVAAVLAGVASLAFSIYWVRSSTASDRSLAANNNPTGARNRQIALKEKAKEEALRFVEVAQGGCQALARKAEALTAESVIDLSELNSFIPTEIYPPDAFGVYVDEKTYADVKSQLSQLVTSLVDMLRTLPRSQVASIAGIERLPEQVIKDRELFQERKLKALANTASYCESIRRGGAGVGGLG